MKEFCNRVWLNSELSSSTGSVVAFSGVANWSDEDKLHQFLELSDCTYKVRLHRSNKDTEQNFIDKMVLLRDTVSEFINHLESCVSE